MGIRRSTLRLLGRLAIAALLVVSTAGTAAGSGVATEGRTVPIQVEVPPSGSGGDKKQPQLSVRPDGRIDLVLVGQNGTAPISIHRYGSAGDWQGASFLGYGADDAKPALATRADGERMVVWESVGSPGDDPGLAIFGRTFSQLGQEVNTYTTGLQQNADVAAGPDGDFVVVWQSAGSVGSDSSGDSIQGRHYTADGTPGPQFQVNTHTTSGQYAPVVAAREGGFVVAWYGFVGHDGNGFGVAMRLLDEDGTPLGSDVAVNSYTTGSQLRADVTSDPFGRFAVVWDSDGSPGGDSDGASIQARAFDAAGGPFSAQSQVNTLTSGDQTAPSITAVGASQFVVAWESGDLAGPDTSSLGIRARTISLGNGGLGGDDWQVNTYTTGEQRHPTIASDRDGHLVLAWESDGSPDTTDPGFSVQQRRVPAEGDLLDGLIAYWDFDVFSGPTLPDRVGTLDGTLHGTQADDHFRRALSFDPLLEDYIELSGVGPEHAISGPEVTVAGWVKLDLLPSEIAENFAGIFDAIIDNYVLYLDRANQELRFKVTNSSGSVARPGIPQSKLSMGRWTHVAGVFDGTAGQAGIYLDGVLADTEALSGNVRSDPEQIPAFGRNGSGAGSEQYYFSGALDDFAIWNRALTLEEIHYLRSDEIFGDGFEVHISLWSAAVGI